MKNIILLIITLISFQYSIAQKDMPIPNPNTWVSDQANILKEPDKISKSLKDWETKYQTGVEFVVVTVKTLENYDPNLYATNLGRKWEVGKIGANNGIVFLIAPNDRKWYIAVGYGIEPFLPDMVIKQIGTDNINIDEFKKGIYDPSIIKVINAIHSKLGTISISERQRWLKEEELVKQRNFEKSKENVFIILICLICLSIIGFVVYKIINRIKKFNKLKDDFNDVKNSSITILKEVKECIDLKYKDINIMPKFSTIKNTLLISFENKLLFFNLKYSEITFNKLRENYKSLLNFHLDIQIRVEKLNYLKEKIKEIENYKLKKYSENIIKKFLAQVEVIKNKYSLNNETSEIENSLLILSKGLDNINNLINKKTTLEINIKNILNDNLIHQNYDNFGIEEYLNKVKNIKNLTIDSNLEKIEKELSIEYKSIIEDIKLKKIILNTKFDFTNELNDINNIHSFIVSKNVKMKNNIYETLTDLVNKSIKLEVLINNKTDFNKNWVKCKSLYNEILTDKIDIDKDIQHYKNIENEYNNSLNKIPLLIIDIDKLIIKSKNTILEKGVSSYTENSYYKYLNNFNTIKNITNSNCDTVINKYKQLIELYKNLKNIIDEAETEHKKYLKKQKDEEEYNNSYSNSSSISFDNFSSSTSSSSSFGGGDFGGGGSGGDW